jgi:hypothetical protein
VIRAPLGNSASVRAISLPSFQESNITLLFH